MYIDTSAAWSEVSFGSGTGYNSACITFLLDAGKTLSDFAGEEEGGIVDFFCDVHDRLALSVPTWMSG